MGWDNGVFKSCQIDCIFELNAHARHHRVVISGGRLQIFFKPRVSELGASVRKHVGCNGCSQRLYICSICNDDTFVEINVKKKIVMHSKTIQVAYTQYDIIV